MFNVYFIRLACSVINIISDVVSLLLCALIVCSKYSHLLKRETMKMILLRRFRVLILMVFLIACSMHIMIDLLPKLERHGGGGGGCSCSNAPGSEQPQSWGGKQLLQGWPSSSSSSNKHTLRILQDFSSELSSNGSSPERSPAAGEGARPGGQRQRQPSARSGRAPDRSSRLGALFEHPLYKKSPPPLTDEDTLFNVNTDIRFDPKAAEEEAW